jgi:hypothetical protein
MGVRITSPQHVDDVADSGAVEGSNDTDLPWESGEWPLTRLIEEPLTREPLLQLLEGQLQRTEACRFEMFADDLILALRVVDADSSACDDAQAVLWLEAQQSQRRPEHDPFNLCVRIFEREVQMPGVPHLAIRQLAFDPDFEEAFLEQPAKFGRQLRDGEDSSLRGRRWNVFVVERLVGFLEWKIEQAHRLDVVAATLEASAASSWSE